MLVSLALLMFGSTSNVFSAQLDRVFTKEFYERILSCPQIQITCLEKHDLIEEISPNLYALKNVRQGTEEERVSGARIVKAIRRPLLLIPDLPGLSGVPTVDAIVFSNDGDPVANLSIKSFLGDSKNGAMALKRNILSGRGSFKNLYNPDHLPNRFGFTLNEDGILSPLAGTQDKRVRLPLLRGTAFLLGIGRQAMRDVWLAIDFLDENKSFSIFSGTLGEGRVPFEGTFLDLLDSRQIEKIEKPKAVHLESLVNRAAEAHEVKRYLVLLNDSLLEVDRNGYRLTTNCEQYLSAL